MGRKGMSRIVLVALPIAAAAIWLAVDRSKPVVVASKSFTEGVVLGEVATRLIADTGTTTAMRWQTSTIGWRTIKSLYWSAMFGMREYCKTERGRM